MPTLPKDIKNVILDFKDQLVWTSKITKVNKHIRHMYMGMLREDYNKEGMEWVGQRSFLMTRMSRLRNILECQKNNVDWKEYPYFYTHMNYYIGFRY